MGRPGLTQHRKFRRLASIIGSVPVALGSLELIWAGCYESGDEFIGDAVDVELAAHWSGTPGELVAALVTAGFIDAAPGGYNVHDLYDHAPDYVQKRMERENARKVRGRTISEERREAGKKGAAARLAKQTAASAEQTAPLAKPGLAKVLTPAPAPAPISLSSASPPVGRFDLEAIYARYPRKGSKTKPLEKLAKGIKSAGDYAALEAAVGNFAAAMAGREPQYIREFSRWVGEWRDWITPQPQPDISPAVAGPRPPRIPDALEVLAARRRAFEADQ